MKNIPFSWRAYKRIGVELAEAVSTVHKCVHLIAVQPCEVYNLSEPINANGCLSYVLHKSHDYNSEEMSYREVAQIIQCEIDRRARTLTGFLPKGVLLSISIEKTKEKNKLNVSIKIRRKMK